MQCFGAILHVKFDCVCESCGLVLFSIQHNILSLLKTVPLCLPCSNTCIDITAVLALHTTTIHLLGQVLQTLERFRCFSFLDLTYYFRLFSFMLFIQWVLVWNQSKAYSPL